MRELFLNFKFNMFHFPLYYDIMWFHQNISAECLESVKYFLVFRIFTKDYCIQLAKPQGEQIGRKAPLPRPQSEENFWLRIYPFGAISSNFGFVAEEPPPTPKVRKIFDFGCIHLGQFQATLVLWQKSPPPPPKWGKFLTSDLSIWGDFKQLWFLWQKSPPPPPPKWGKFLTSDNPLGQFRATLVLWQKSPPYPKVRKIFDFRCIHFGWFRATLVFVAENRSFQKGTVPN